MLQIRTLPFHPQFQWMCRFMCPHTNSTPSWFSKPSDVVLQYTHCEQSKKHTLQTIENLSCSTFQLYTRLPIDKFILLSEKVIIPIFSSSSGQITSLGNIIVNGSFCPCDMDTQTYTTQYVAGCNLYVRLKKFNNSQCFNNLNSTT